MACNSAVCIINGSRHSLLHYQDGCARACVGGLVPRCMWCELCQKIAPYLVSRLHRLPPRCIFCHYCLYFFHPPIFCFVCDSAMFAFSWSPSSSCNCALWTGVRILLTCLLRSGGLKDGLLTPIPQYPLYSASLTLLGGTLVPYHLSEGGNWGVEVSTKPHALRLHMYWWCYSLDFIRHVRFEIEDFVEDTHLCRLRVLRR